MYYLYVYIYCLYIYCLYILYYIYILNIYIYIIYIYMSYICMSSYSVSRPSCLSRVSTWQNPAEWFDACLDKHQDILGISLKVRSTTKNTHGERLKKNIWSWVNACLEPCLENTKPFGTLTLQIYLLQAPPWQRPKCFRLFVPCWPPTERALQKIPALPDSSLNAIQIVRDDTTLAAMSNLLPI